MKFVRNIILALALFLPSISMAEGDSTYTPKKKASDYIPRPNGIEVGGGNMFVARLEWSNFRSLKIFSCSTKLGASFCFSIFGEAVKIFLESTL